MKIWGEQIMKKHVKEILILLISAVLITLPLWNRQLYLLTWPGLIAGMAVFHRTKKLRGAFIKGWFWGGILALCFSYWLFHPIRNFSGLPLPMVLFLLVVLFAAAGIFYAMWASAYKILNPGDEFSVLIAAFTWVSFEFLRAIFFPYFPFGFIGLTQTGFDTLLQLAEIGGVFLISFITILLSGLLYKFLLSKRFLYLLLVLIIFLSSSFYTSSLINERREFWQENSRNFEAGIIMTGIDQEEKWEEENIEKNLKRVADKIESAFAKEADIVFTPETSLTFDYLRNEYYRDKFYDNLNPMGYFMVGSQSSGDDPAETLNSYFLIDEYKNIQGRYNKNDLIPGEVIPLAGVAEFFTGREWHSLTRGEEQEFMSFEASHEDDFSFRVLTCSEILYASDDYSRLNEVDMLVNPSNEAWFGDTNLQSQMWESARLRAVELRVPVFKSGNKAYSGYIEPDGEDRAVDDKYTTIDAAAGRASAEKTIYQRLGDYPGYISLVMMLIVIPGIRLYQA